MMIMPESHSGHRVLIFKDPKVPSVLSMSVVRGQGTGRVPGCRFSLVLSSHILLFSPPPQLVGNGWVPAVPRTLRSPILMIPQDQHSKMGEFGGLSSATEVPHAAFCYIL